jgi:hypothetical protein
MTTTITGNRAIDARARQIVEVLGRAGILPDETTLAAMAVARDRLEQELANTMAADLLTALAGATVNRFGQCASCDALINEHFDATRRWIGCRRG